MLFIQQHSDNYLQCVDMYCTTLTLDDNRPVVLTKILRKLWLKGIV
jgi:hypothetical protein